MHSGFMHSGSVDTWSLPSFMLLLLGLFEGKGEIQEDGAIDSAD